MKPDPVWLVFLVLAGALVLGSLYCAYRAMRFRERAEERDGTVIGLKQISHPRRQPTYAPVVQFQAPNGRLITFTASFSANPALHAVGQTIRVLCPPDQPENARLASRWTLYFAPAVMLIIGVGFTLIGAYGSGINPLDVARNAAAPGRRDVGELAGKWVNVNAATAGITRIEIGSGWAGAKINLWGKCHPVDCDWGRLRPTITRRCRAAT
jgi:hypothetical protein